MNLRFTQGGIKADRLTQAAIQWLAKILLELWKVRDLLQLLANLPRHSRSCEDTNNVV